MTKIINLGEHSPTIKKLKTGRLTYSVQMLLQVLSNFAKSPEGAGSGVMLVLPDGINPMQKEFNIKEIQLVENKIVGAVEKYRAVILVD